jgi:hypothetical protein
VAIFLFDKNTPFPSIYTLVPTIGAVLIILFSSQETLVGKLLSNKFFVWIGLISYSTYLWHQPLFAFARQRILYDKSQFLFLSLAIAAILLGYLTWRFIEKPFRNRQKISRKQVFIASILCSLFFITFGVFGNQTKGYPKRLDNQLKLKDIEFSKIDNGYCFYSIDSMSDLTYGKRGTECWLGNKSSLSKGVLFGDSFAGQYEPFWNIVASSSNLNLNINSITTNWCHPALNNDFNAPTSSRAFNQCKFNRKFIIDEISNYDFVILSGNWGGLLSENKLNGVFDFIDFASKKSKLVILMPSPKQYDENVMDLYKKSIIFKSEFNMSKVSSSKDYYALKSNELIRIYSKRYENVLFLDRDSVFNASENNMTKDNIPYSFDGSHLSIYGAKSAADSYLNTESYQYLKKLFKD